MEKMAFYLFRSGVITVLLMFLAYAWELFAVQIAARRMSLATEPAGTAEVTAPGPSAVGRYGTLLGWMSVVVLGFAIFARTMASGRGPFADMYDFSIAFASGIVLIYMIIEWRYRSRALGVVVLPFALGLMFYAMTLPSRIDPLVPALQNATLLTLHVSVAILAYSAFAVSFGAAVLYLVQDRIKASRLPGLDALDEVAFLSSALAFPFMTLVLVLGAYWANTAWGRYWGWDPKETASLVTWLIYAVYLHMRALRGWRGRRSAWVLVIGFAAVLLTYFGNYFLDGLHSYS